MAEGLLSPRRAGRPLLALENPSWSENERQISTQSGPLSSGAKRQIFTTSGSSIALRSMSGRLTMSQPSRWALAAAKRLDAAIVEIVAAELGGRPKAKPSRRKHDGARADRRRYAPRS